MLYYIYIYIYKNIKFIEKVIFVCLSLVIYCTIQLFRFAGVYWKSIFPESRQIIFVHSYTTPRWDFCIPLAAFFL